MKLRHTSSTYARPLSRECVRDTLLVKRNYGKHIPVGLVRALYSNTVRRLRDTVLKPYTETVLVPGRYLALQKEKRCGEPEWFGMVRWCDEDLRNALETHDIAPTAANVSKLRHACSHHSFEDHQIEAGWNYIYSVINYETGWEESE